MARMLHVPSEDDVILEVFAHCGKIDLDWDIGGFQSGTVSDPAQLEDMWGPDGTGESI